MRQDPPLGWAKDARTTLKDPAANSDVPYWRLYMTYIGQNKFGPNSRGDGLEGPSLDGEAALRKNLSQR